MKRALILSAVLVIALMALTLPEAAFPETAEAQTPPAQIPKPTIKIRANGKIGVNWDPRSRSDLLRLPLRIGQRCSSYICLALLNSRLCTSALPRSWKPIPRPIGGKERSGTLVGMVGMVGLDEPVWGARTDTQTGN